MMVYICNPSTWEEYEASLNYIVRQCPQQNKTKQNYLLPNIHALKDTIKKMKGAGCKWFKRKERLPSKREALSSNPMLPEKKKLKYI
jgi:hypothetical protein